MNNKSFLRTAREGLKSLVYVVLPIVLAVVVYRLVILPTPEKTPLLPQGETPGILDKLGAQTAVAVIIVMMGLLAWVFWLFIQFGRRLAERGYLGPLTRDALARTEMAVVYSTVAIVGVSALLVGGCTIRVREPPATGGDRAATSGEESEVFLAPVPVTEFVPEVEPAIESEFLFYLETADPESTTIVRGQIEDLSVSERAVPDYVAPREEMLIVTKATLQVADVLCGPRLTDTTEFSFLGGSIGTRSYLDSLTPALNVGQDYVALLTEVDGEYFLLGGRNELLVPTYEEDIYQDFYGLKVSEATILEGCR